MCIRDRYWNTVAFQALYARTNGWTPGDAPSPADRHVLDRWLLSVTHELVRDVTNDLENFDVGAAASVSTTRSCQTRSVMNGTIGAMSLVTMSSTSCSVWSAEGSPSQKRRRDLRTYQFDRSSVNADSLVPAASVSKFSRSLVTSRTSSCVTLS